MKDFQYVCQFYLPKEYASDKKYETGKNQFPKYIGKKEFFNESYPAKCGLASFLMAQQLRPHPSYWNLSSDAKENSVKFAEYVKFFRDRTGSGFNEAASFTDISLWANGNAKQHGFFETNLNGKARVLAAVNHIYFSKKSQNARDKIKSAIEEGLKYGYPVIFHAKINGKGKPGDADYFTKQTATHLFVLVAIKRTATQSGSRLFFSDPLANEGLKIYVVDYSKLLDAAYNDINNCFNALIIKGI